MNMDKFSDSKSRLLEELLEYATLVEVTDARTFLRALSEDESIDIAQKLEIVKSIVEALGENCFLKKKRYIKRRYRHAVNMVDDSTSSDEEINYHHRYTRPYRKYKARKCSRPKKSCIAENVRAIDDSLKHLGYMKTEEGSSATKYAQMTDLHARKSSIRNLLPDKKLSESAEHFLNRYIEAYIHSINNVTTMPVDCANLQPALNSLEIEKFARNTCVKENSLPLKTPGPREIQSSTRVMLKPVKPDRLAMPSTSTHLSDTDEPLLQQEPFWKRLNRYRYTTHHPDECEEETS